MRRESAYAYLRRCKIRIPTSVGWHCISNTVLGFLKKFVLARQSCAAIHTQHVRRSPNLTSDVGRVRVR
jgi:hypothetical protein